uniref:Uncharacterized protein n=1 Tax=Anguilla anguilla TaxID=7936 RepID=A0A0E9WB29_ANGAN
MCTFDFFLSAFFIFFTMGYSKYPEKEEWTYWPAYSPAAWSDGSWMCTVSPNLSGTTALPDAWSRKPFLYSSYVYMVGSLFLKRATHTLAPLQWTW